MRKAAKRFWKNHFDADVNYTGFCEKITTIFNQEQMGFPDNPFTHYWE